MEIKATLLKPYTDVERINFIVQQNHQLGYEIRETETALEAWGYTQEEIAEQEKQKTINGLKEQLNALDLKSIRAIRSNDTEYIAQYEAQAQSLREQIRELEGV